MYLQPQLRGTSRREMRFRASAINAGYRVQSSVDSLLYCMRNFHIRFDIVKLNSVNDRDLLVIILWSAFKR